MHVDIWSDIVCPWCYVGKRRLESALAAFEDPDGVEVVHHSFQLDPSAARDRTSSRRERLMKKYGLTPEQMDESDTRMAEIAAAEGLAYHLEGVVSGNTRDAHQLVHFARAHAREDAMIERLYRAYFTEQRSVFERDSLVGLAHDVGLDAGAAADVLRERRYESAVEEDIDAARRLGITGVPFFVIDGKYGVSGAQQPAVFLEAFARAAAAVPDRH
jgi:predicted DsbA family dithiol-disulfide isomerase